MHHTNRRRFLGFVGMGAAGALLAACAGAPPTPTAAEAG